MQNVIDNNNYKKEFLSIINDLLMNDDVKRLSEFSQHFDTSRLAHSINVSYYSYKAAKKLGLDYCSAARAALLHDLFLYDWRVEKQPEGAHAFAHPVVALRNANKVTELNEIEKDAIVNHMWPVTPAFPKYMESYVVSFADKYSTVLEVAAQIKHKTKRRYFIVKEAILGV